jgi:drug/metabolite transporter superfamily protein YnfA
MSNAPIVLYPSKGLAAVASGFGALAIALGVGFIIAGTVAAAVFGGVLAAVGGFMIAASVAPLLPDRAWLRIDDAGVTMKWLGRRGHYAWADIERFGAKTEGKNAWVAAIRLRPHHPEYTPSPPYGLDVGLGPWSLEHTALIRLLEERHRAATLRQP